MAERVVRWEHRETGLSIFTRDEAGKLRRYDGCRLEGRYPAPGSAWTPGEVPSVDLRGPGEGAR